MPMAVTTTNSCGQAADKMDGAREKLRRWRLVTGTQSGGLDSTAPMMDIGGRAAGIDKTVDGDEDW